ncbi:MAG: hypothetical protein U0031_11750 [Thermomicrobiales bacterium]
MYVVAVAATFIYFYPIYTAIRSTSIRCTPGCGYQLALSGQTG